MTFITNDAAGALYDISSDVFIADKGLFA